MNPTASPVKKALLVGLKLPKTTDQELQSSLVELERLVHTMGYEVVGTMKQKRGSLRGALVVGEGKLKEIARWTGGTGQVASLVVRKKNKAQERWEEDQEDEESEGLGLNDEPEEDMDVVGGPPQGVKADVVIFDSELSPSQTRNLESATGAQVLDRTGVIIEIFSRHARTRTARLQVEIARLKYLAPRMRETGGTADREGGGMGGKGAGESSQELDRRNIRDRIKELKTELESVQGESSLRRNRRQEENSIALVGYTNAGKSSLMRALTGSEVLVADKLFATLDTTVRPLYPESIPKVLVSDTVGFIDKLPHDLVASFRSTLEEALNADHLLFVVDSSDPAFRAQLQVTQKVLGEIGALEIPSLLVLNKRDNLSAEDQQTLLREFPGSIAISTRDKKDLGLLREKILEFFEKDMMEAEIQVPYDAQGAMGEVRRSMRVLGESYNEKGALLTVKSRKSVLENFRKRFNLKGD